MEEEALEALIKRAVDLCFEDDISKTIASDTLRKSANLTERVQSLELSVLKAIVKKRRKRDVTADILFSLIFKERLDIVNFHDSYGRFDNRKQEAFQKQRNDPYFVYAVVQQNANRCYFGLVLTTTHLLIQCNRKVIGAIPNRRNKRFDTFWASRFFQLCLKMRCVKVKLALEDNWRHNVAYHRSLLNRVIDSVKQVTPAEGWEQAIAKGDLAIYERDDSRWLTTHYSYFMIITNNSSSIPSNNHYYAFQV